MSAPAGMATVMLDGLLLWGEAARAASTSAAGWIPEEQALALPLPLARVTMPDGRWWYACSAASPPSPIEKKQHTTYVNRRPDMAMFQVLTTAKSIDERAGPDKLIHKPRYIWPFWLTMEWTCIGDPVAIRRALSFVHGVGPGVPQGVGTVRPLGLGWDVAEDPTAPPLDAYRTDARLRPLPIDVAPPPPVASFTRSPMALRPPYWQRGVRELCWKVQ
jgi:hypothetical protein